MDVQRLQELAADFTDSSPYNYVPNELALSPELAGIRLCRHPLTGIAAAGDPLFREFKETRSALPYFLMPEEWLPDCRSVISFFFPYTKEVIDSNSLDFDYPSLLWMHGRIEGEAFIKQFLRYIAQKLEETGMTCLIPSLDPRFRSTSSPSGGPGGTPLYTSSWSERHAAYAAGLGTFGLSKGLITKKGVAGRFGSLLTTGSFPVTRRDYSGLFDYCSNCGLCVKHCPVNAISFGKGKEHPPCSAFINAIEAKHKPWYGCAKCQMKTPCTFKPAVPPAGGVAV